MPPRANTPLESQIQRTILDYLRIKGYVCRRNNTGAMLASYNGKQRFVRFSEPGWPDIEGILPDGRFFGIEVKRPGNKPTPVQIAVADKILASNGVYVVAYSLQDVIDHGL